MVVPVIVRFIVRVTRIQGRCRSKLYRRIQPAMEYQRPSKCT
jgi:hypothetical protein